MKWQKTTNLIYCLLLCCCIIYGVASITYATETSSQVDATLTIHQDGSFSSTGDIFSNGIWYPGYQKEGILRIVNNYKGANINSLGLDIRIIEQKVGLSQELVYNSFLDKMILTIEKGRLFNFTKRIVEQRTLRDLLMTGIDFSPSMIALSNSMDFRYTLKMDESATNELQSIKALIGFNFKAGEVINNEVDPGNNDSGQGESSSVEQSTIPVAKPSGGLIDRSPGYIDLNEMKEIKEIVDRVVIPYNSELLKENPEHLPRIYYWNEGIEKWIALASYVTDPYNVMAINDGGYTGFFKVFGVVQPLFTDVMGHWAEVIVNRMNGLGILEGYPGDGLIRTAQLDKNITRIEFATLIYRLVNINPDKIYLQQCIAEEAQAVLIRHFKDAEDIPLWVRSVVATMTKEGLIQGKEGSFRANEAITCSEAIAMVSSVLDLIGGQQTLDLLSFIQTEKLPCWAKAFISEDLIIKDMDDILITRAEALIGLQYLFINGMGL